MGINSVCYFGDFNRHLQRVVQQYGNNADLLNQAGMFPLVVVLLIKPIHKQFLCIFVFYYCVIIFLQR